MQHVDIDGAVPFAFADGSVRLFPDSTPCDVLRSLFVRNDGLGDTSGALDYAVAPEPATLTRLGLALSAVALARARSRRAA